MMGETLAWLAEGSRHSFNAGVLVGGGTIGAVSLAASGNIYPAIIAGALAALGAWGRWYIARIIARTIEP